MAAIDKLVIEITGDATGLSKALAQAQKNLTAFNTNIALGNKAINAFVSNTNKGATAAKNLAATVNTVRTTFTALNRTASSTASTFARFGATARTANSDIKSFASNLNKVAGSFERISGASKSATAAINSLQRRVAALSTTVSATNASMRTFNRTVEMGTAGARAGGIVVNNYGKNVDGAGGAARRTSGSFGGLHKANLTLMEGFRRHVAQITALRTLVYQAAFWFGPLIYSIIKVNAEYETLMQRLRNLSNQTTELAKNNWAEKTRQQLIELANTNPFSLHTITDTFVKMRTVGLDPLNGSLQTLMDSIAYFGGGNQQLANASLALQEMVGKTAVSMKELRRQLGQVIPDAMKSMAEGMGMSMRDFYKTVQSGTIESREAIKKMFAVLDMAHRGAASTMMMTWNGMLARMTTAWQNFVAMIEHHPGRNTFIDILKKNLNELMVFLNSPAGMNFAISIDNALATVATGFKNLLEFVYKWRDAIVNGAKIFAIMWGGRLIIGTLTSLISIFAAVVRAILLTTNALRGAAAAQGIFAAAVRGAAVAMGVAATAEEAAAMSLGALTATMLGAVGIAVALAGAVWLIVTALNAQTEAQKQANLAKKASQGYAWSDIDRDGNSKERDTRRQEVQALKDRYKAGGYWTKAQPNQAPIFIKDDPATHEKYRQQALAGVNSFNLTQANTRNSMRSMVNTEFEQSQPDPYAKTKAKYDALKYPLDAQGKPIDVDPKKRLELDQQEAHDLAGDAMGDIYRLRKMKQGASPAMQSAIDQMIEKREGDINSYINKDAAALKEPNAFVKGDGKKKGKKDPLAGLDNRYAESYVQTADLEHQYSDLKNGTSTDFDAEGARKEGERRASLLKTKEALRLALEAEKSRREEIKKSIFVEQAIIDVTNKRKETETQLTEDLHDLTMGYQSISDQSDRYKTKLEAEYQRQLQVAEARLHNGKATADEVRQYNQLIQAIDGAVRAQQAELVVKKAQEAKQANQNYYSTFRSPGQQANYDRNIEIKEYSDALKVATDLADKNTRADRDLADAQAELNRLVKSATDDGKTENEINNDAIIITAKRRVQEDLETQAAKDSIPYLQERVRILQEEAAARNKWNGAGGPLLDWAKKANTDMNNLGESMGNVLVGAMDDFINSIVDGKAKFGDFVKALLKGLLLIIIRALLAKAILSALGFNSGGLTAGGVSGGTSPSGGFAVGASHSGGVAGGPPSFYKQVNPEIFSFAQRYHTGGVVGLGSNEVPIIAEKGEGVFTREQMQAMGNNNKGSNIQVNVINQTGVEADVHHDKPRFDGEKWVETIILKKMAQPGPVRDSLTAMAKR